MLTNYKHLIEMTKARGCARVSVACAQDEEVLLAVKGAYDAGIATAILVGDAELIRPLAEKVGLPADIRIEDVKDIDAAALRAVELVSTGEADILVKGLVNSSSFLHAALDKKVGLRTGGMLSHLACFEIPGEKKLAFHTDGGMNIQPDLAAKVDIVRNALQALRTMGIAKPNVAVLTANERVNDKMPATVDAKALADMGARGEFGDCVIEGPIAMDVAASADNAHHKGIKSRIAGDVDLFVVPSIEAGNFVGKTLVCYAHAKMTGLVLGARRPIVLVSRSDTAEAKLNSIALACLALTKD